jgi:hypothetical protein
VAEWEAEVASLYPAESSPRVADRDLAPVPPRGSPAPVPAPKRRPTGELAGMFVAGLVIGLAAGWYAFGRPSAREAAGSATTLAGAPAARPATATTRATVESPGPGGQGPEPGAPTRRPQKPAAAPAAPTPAAAATPRGSAAPTAPKPAQASATPTGSAKPTAPVAAPAKAGRLAISSTPPGARVEVNGRVRGRTPLTLGDLSLGAQTVRLTQSGYAAAERRVTLTSARPSQSLSVPLTRAAAVPRPPAAAATYFGTMVVETRPSGARVFLDGREVGTTPLDLPKVSAGSHVVRLELEGYSRWTASVQVVAGERNRVAASLEEREVR